jgi:Tfp pilus assembly protein PilN
MIARPLRGRGGRPIGIRIGGFNLLPYRQRVARGRRQRCVVECTAAALAGALAALAWSAWDGFEHARLVDRRAALESTLAGFAAPLAEFRRLEGMSARASEHAALAADLARPRARILDTVDALSRVPPSGVVLHRLKLTDGGVEVDASAVDSASSAAWIDRLARVRGVRSAEITDWRLAAEGARHAIDVGARLQWDDAGVTHASAVRHGAGRGRR